MDGKFVFAGNRAFVLEKMLSLGLQITKIWAVENSVLQNYLENNKLDICYTIIGDKKQFLSEIANTDFNYFISNGLPVILPIEELQVQNKKFINIHPSLLPELRGRDPVPGGLLYEKALGVTCHYMDEGIDTGKIISQVEIDRSDDLDAGLLYQLSFLAEADVFEEAYNRNFEIAGEQVYTGKEIYYSFKSKDLEIDLQKNSVNAILAKVKAFSTKNKGAFLYIMELYINVRERRL